MYAGEQHGLLDPHPAEKAWTGLPKWHAWTAMGRSSARVCGWSPRRGLRHLYLGLVLCILAVVAYLFDTPAASLRLGSAAADSPFAGAFARFPRTSTLSPRYQRITLVAVWNADGFPSSLRHALYTIQLNAQYLDLVLINRLPTPESRCLDFDAARVDIGWGGNIVYECLTEAEYKQRHVDLLCSAEYGWNCNASEYDEVAQELWTREDKTNTQWRPLHGYMFRDYFPRDNALWAWADLDIFYGNFAHYPFNVASQLSILTGYHIMPRRIFMPGQFTVFNFDSTALGSVWKLFPEMKTAAHFTKGIDGKMPQPKEEGYWSYGYLNSDPGFPGEQLSWAMYPDIHGDDFYDGSFKGKTSKHVYVISGRDVLLTSSSYDRETIETLLALERAQPVDDLGGLGWTGGADGSEYLLQDSTLSSDEAKRMAVEKARAGHATAQIHSGIVEDTEIQAGCAQGMKWKQCVESNPLEIADPPVMRGTVVHFKEQQAGHVLRRLELDDRPRPYERKLFKHHLKAKKWPWYEYPPFDITEDLVLRLNNQVVEVFRIGPSRNDTLFYRSENGK